MNTFNDWFSYCEEQHAKLGDEFPFHLFYYRKIPSNAPQEAWVDLMKHLVVSKDKWKADETVAFLSNYESRDALRKSLVSKESISKASQQVIYLL